MTPVLVLSAGLVSLLALGAAFRRLSPTVYRAFAFIILAAGAFQCSAVHCFPELAGPDGLSRFWQVLFVLGALPLVLVLPASDEAPFALVVGSVLGMALLASARNLLVLFLGLELMSLPAYVLVYSLSKSPRTLEAAVKYFFAGGAAAAFYLLGMAVVYASTGSLDFGLLPGAVPPLGLALLGAAALFKLGAVPLHFWLPDVYEASLPELTGFFSTSVKAAGFLILIRVLAAGPAAAPFAEALPLLAALTMLLGAFLALRQSSLQRLLAYSSLSHAGFILMGVSSWHRQGMLPGRMSPVFIYLAAYLLMNSGAFMALRLSGARTTSELRGLAKRRPMVAAFLALFLLSLAGLPPTAGFLAKLLVFWDAIAARSWGLVAAAALSSLIGLGYYFRLLRTIYFEEGPETAPAPALDAGRFVLWACGLPTLVLGLSPWLNQWVTIALER